MKLIYPEFLFALLAVAIPIIVHLFNFRRYKKQYFTNVRYLKEIQFETKSRSQLKHLLILISRILLVSFLVLAFAQPFIPAGQDREQGTTAVGIYLDNSFSMEGSGEEISLHEFGAKKAQEIAKAYPSGTQFYFLDNDFLGKHHRAQDHGGFENHVTSAATGPNARTLSEVVNRFGTYDQGNSESMDLYLISDFQRHITDLDALSLDSALSIKLIPLPHQLDQNVLIDSCWFEQPRHQLDGSEKLYVRVVNRTGTELENYPVQLSINGQQKALGNFNAPAGSSAELTIDFTNDAYGLQQGQLSITDHPITFDDDFFFTFKVDSTIRVNLISQEEEQRPLSAVFDQPIFNYRVDAASAIDFQALYRQDLIVVNGLDQYASGMINSLKELLEAGKKLVIIPPSGEIEGVNSFLDALGLHGLAPIDTQRRKISAVNYQSEMYREVFESAPDELYLFTMPGYHPLMNRSVYRYEDLLTFEDGAPFLRRYFAGDGLLYLFTAPIDNSPFERHSLFVPTFHQMAVLSQAHFPLFHTIGDEEGIAVAERENGEAIYHISNGQTDIIPQFRTIDNKGFVFLREALQKAGLYSLSSEGKTVQGIALNYNRSESDLSVYAPEQLEDMIGKYGLDHVALMDDPERNYTQVISGLIEGRPLWKYCIILALVFITMEILLIKLWK